MGREQAWMFKEEEVQRPNSISMEEVDNRSTSIEYVGVRGTPEQSEQETE
jgi:hypothetical protein